MRKSILNLILLFTVVNLFGQQEGFSSHEVEFYVDGEAKKLNLLKHLLLQKMIL